ncbi:MAG: hypothetical protein U0L97_03040 [Candidatus Saccharimonadaceae bacterium]|nr:hypothetical protein [Candidatus Saccharimonadaceae bacterium]
MKLKGIEIDNRVWGMMIAKFSWEPFLRRVEYVDEESGERRGMTDEERYETVISLLEKEALCICELPDGKATIRPRLGDEEVEGDITSGIDLESLKGRYEEMAKFQRGMENDS